LEEQKLQDKKPPIINLTIQCIQGILYIMEPSNITITTKLPAGLFRQLEELAVETDRKKSYLIRQAIAEYLEDRADYDMAVERLKKPGKRIPLSKVKKRLGLDD
jgi:RHH-type rel operon transcriptional repressor/antitoxin RelB